MEKMLSANHKLVLVGLLLLTLAIGMYSNRKSSPSVSEGMQIRNKTRYNSMNRSNLAPPNRKLLREGFKQRTRREGFENQRPPSTGGGTSNSPNVQSVQQTRLPRTQHQRYHQKV